MPNLTSRAILRDFATSLWIYGYIHEVQWILRSFMDTSVASTEKTMIFSNHALIFPGFQGEKKYVQILKIPPPQVIFYLKLRL